jgi:hypothetical protein
VKRAAAVDIALALKKVGKSLVLLRCTQAHFQENWHKACGKLGFQHAVPSCTSTHTALSEDPERN